MRRLAQEQAGQQSRQSCTGLEAEMSRICDRCKSSVIVGQGKWLNDAKSSDKHVKVLRHISVALCDKAATLSQGRENSLAQARMAKFKAS